jgi:hypothetical protein
LSREYVTKIWIGRHWRYVRTRRKYVFRTWRKLGVVSYRALRDDDDRAR